MSEIKIVTSKIRLSELRMMAEVQFGVFVKAVVDIEEKIMAIGAELHSDEVAMLLEHGSKQINLWGINIYPDEKEDRIEFDSMINIRPIRAIVHAMLKVKSCRQRLFKW